MPAIFLWIMQIVYDYFPYILTSSGVKFNCNVPAPTTPLVFEPGLIAHSESQASKFDWIAKYSSGYYWLQLHRDVFQLDRQHSCLMWLVKIVSQHISSTSRSMMWLVKIVSQHISSTSRSMNLMLTSSANYICLSKDKKWCQAILSFRIGVILRRSVATMCLYLRTIRRSGSPRCMDSWMAAWTKWTNRNTLP